MIIKGKKVIKGEEFNYVIKDVDGGFDLEVNGYFANIEEASLAFDMVKDAHSEFAFVSDNYDFYSDIIFNDDLPWVE